MIARYKFCLWLIDKLSLRRMTYAEISYEWESAAANINGVSLTPRSFLRYRILAEEIFNVNIECHKPTNEYWLDTESVKDSDKWLMSALRVQNLTSMVGMRSRIMLEEPPAGTALLETVANACRESRFLSFSYTSPYGEPRSFRVAPLFLRLYRQRWYLIAQPVGAEYTATLALDRISGLSVGETSEPTVDINPEEYFRDCFGIIRQHEPTKVVVRAFWPQNVYLKEVPLHSSQTVVEETENFTDFSLYVRPTYDFKQELLWHRDKLAVISPEWLRDDLIDIMERMIRSYRTGESNCKDE